MMKAFLIIVITGMLLLAAGWFSLTYYANHPGPLSDTTIIMIEPGDSFDEITDQLAEQKAISFPLLFKAWVVAHGLHHQFKAGEFELEKDITPDAIIDILVGGKSIQHSVTVPEGLISKDILTIVRDTKLLTGDPPASLPEGTLLPETYYFLRNTSRTEIIRRMQDAMRRTLDTAWQGRDQNLPFTTKEEALILASIVEKETGIAEERPHVASVFVNRLRQNMKLQSDPTTLYGVYAKTGELKQSLTFKDLEQSTPYNTYVIEGLPPGPICHPGKESIQAVLHPTDTRDLYFVATGTGGHARLPKPIGT
ncbi:MAG: endolytic transglycosylase MltG [Rickettsiales bacterium]